jgi:lipoteichoic acid synthase
VALASFAALDMPLFWAAWRRRERSPGVHSPVLAGAVLLVSAFAVMFAHAQPYHLDDNVLSGAVVGRLRSASGDREMLAGACDAQAAAVAVTSGAPARGRNVVLFIAESLSWSASSLADPRLATTPFVAELAALGPIATRSRVQAAASTKSIYTLLTGRYSNPHLEMLESLPPRIEGLPSALRRAGYFTVFLTSQFLSFQNSGRQYRAMGFDRLIGAEEIIARGRRGGHPARLSSSWGVDDRELIGALPELLQQSGGRPLFLVVYDVASHHPYDFPGHAPEDGDYERYLHALRYGDDAFRGVFQALGHREDTLFVLAGDHGENVTPSRYTVRGCLLAEVEHVVPLVFALPGARLPVRAPPARHIDVAPTILDLLGLHAELPMQGRSLFNSGPAPVAYINSYGRCETAGLVDGDTKLLYDGHTHRALAIDLTLPDADAHPRPLPPGDAHSLATRLAACAAYNELALRSLIPGEHPTPGKALAAP